MLSPERCPGPEEVEPEEVQERREYMSGGSVQVEGVCRWRECAGGGSVQVEEGWSSRRKVRSWT